ncbi:hypothetical protein FSI17_020590, partial [Escherichia coli]|nr:hypothetical protein [Escherichia coli]
MSQKFAVMIAYDDDPNVKRYSPDFQTQDEFAKGWQSALKKAHHTSGQKSVITCGCRGKGEKRLYVRALPNGVNRPGFPGECFICELRLP